eukprot:gene4843-5090_t
MFQPFAELTNRTPSPAQPDNDVKYRKHSPWTAARQKKKTRSVEEDKSNFQRSTVPADCFNSPEVQVKSGGVTNRVQPEYSLADGLSPAASQSSGSLHSSPPIDRGEDAEIHPAKAYIVDSQGSGAAQHQQVSASELEPCHGSVQWFENKLQEAAEEGDTALAAQLWQVMQAGSILPSRKVMNNYL